MLLNKLSAYLAMRGVENVEWKWRPVVWT